MKILNNKKGYTLSGLSPQEMSTIMYLLGNIRKQCFREPENEKGDYFSGDGFSAVLTADQLNDFWSIVDEWENRPW